LQSTTRFGSPTTWTDVSGQSPVTVPMTEAATFYRAISP
jgi:hypothetical protein